LIFTNPSQSRESILILEWGKHSLSFSIFHEVDNRVLNTQIIDIHYSLYDATKHEIERIIKDTEIFAYSFSKVICLVDTNYLTLVPTPFFDVDKMEEVLQLNLDLPSGNLIYKNQSVLSSPYEALYCIPKNLKEVIDANFLNVSYSTSNISLLNYFMKQNQLYSFFCVHFNLEFLSIFYYKDNKLLFFNTFTYITAEDVVYHILNVMNELNLNNERDVVYYSGAVSDSNTEIALLKDYFKFLKPVERSNKLNYNSEVQKIASHYFIHHYANCL